MGGTLDDTPLDTIDCASIENGPALGPFSVESARLTVARSGGAAAVDGLFIYVVGGHDEHGVLASVDRIEVQRDGTLGAAVRERAELQVPRANANAIALDGVLYVLGGEAANGSTDTIEAATIEGDGHLSTFSPISDFPGPTVVYAALLRIGRSLYLLGGYDRMETDTIYSATASPFGRLERTDQHMSARRDSHAAFELGGAVYVLGGNTDGNTLDSAEAANVAGDTLGVFGPLGFKLTKPRQNFGSVVVDDRVFVLGGYTGAGSDDSVEQLSLE